MPEKIIHGIVNKIIFKNEENHFAIFTIERDKEDEVCVLTNHPNIFENISYEFHGEWVNHKKFGKQFKASTSNKIMPETLLGIKLYLQSGLFPGVGIVIAERIVNHFGQDTVHIFTNDIERLREVKGISKKKLEAIKEKWQEDAEFNKIIIFLQNFGIPISYAKKIYKFYGSRCVEKIKENPYQLINDVIGVGFKKADIIAKQLMDKNDERRIQAGILYTIESMNQSGHCYLTKEQLIEKTCEVLELNIDDIFLLQKNIDILIENKNIIEQNVEENITVYYNKRVYYNEVYVAEKIKQIQLNQSNLGGFSKNMVDERDDGIELSLEQKETVCGIIGNGVAILTGGPGCGKTITTRTVVDIFLKLHKKVSLCAFAGKAAQRMTEAIGVEATTIHRLLGFNPETQSFMHNEFNQLDSDVFIIDESSMIDINLMADLLKAIPSNSRILFVGDADQLPPISAGQPFCDIINSGLVKVFRLTKIFRQHNESLIVKYAHNFNSGIVPDIGNPLLDPSLWEKKTDCLFIESGLKKEDIPGSAYPKENSLRYGHDIMNMVIELYVKTIKKYFGDKNDIQIIVPMNKGEIGTTAMNIQIQKAVNPKSANKLEIEFSDEKTFRIGDKVIQMKNNYDIGVMNGEIGIIESIDLVNKLTYVKFANDKLVPYERDDLFDLNLGYAITIHKIQGSEYQYGIMVLTSQHKRMLNRRLVYTGHTRAKKLNVFVGERSVLKYAIDNTNYETRQTYLRERLIEKVSNFHAI